MTKRRTIIAALGTSAAAAAAYAIGLFAELEQVLLFAGLYLVWFFLYAILFAAVQKFISKPSIRIVTVGLLTTAAWPVFIWASSAVALTFFMVLPFLAGLYFLQWGGIWGFDALFPWLDPRLWLVLGFGCGCALGIVSEKVRRYRHVH